MIRAFALSLGDLSDRAILGIFLKSIVLTLVVLVLLGTGLFFGARSLAASLLPADAGTIAGVAAVLGAIAIGWLLFRIVAIAVIGLFGDEIVVAVERRHYPQALASARPVSFARSLRLGLASAIRALVVNLLLVPAYILLLLTGVGTPILFFVANGWLLGRDLGEMVATRHIAAADLKAWRVSARIERFGLGLVVSGLLSVPGINLIAPIMGAAMATHLFHGRKA